MSPRRTSGRRILLVGLPGSGKTTFLAALWYALTNPRPQGGQLRVRDLAADRTYLNSISEQWMRCEQVDRTVRSDRPHSVELRLVDTENQQLDLVVPDLSGELFRTLWDDRCWPTRLADLLEESQGILLFVHPDQRLEAPLIEDAEQQAIAAAASSRAAVEAADQADPGPAREFSVPDVSDTVQLIDILQCLSWLRHDPLQQPLAVVVSAWDLVPPAVSQTPEDFLRLAAPLLYQFLISQSGSRPIRYWGISAQGGHYPEDAEKVSEMDNPIDRVKVRNSEPEAEADYHDLGAPLVWLLRRMAKES